MKRRLQIGASVHIRSAPRLLTFVVRRGWKTVDWRRTIDGKPGPLQEMELMMAVKPIPDGYHVVTPYLYFKEGSRAIEFYKKAFGAKERMRMPGPNNTIAHAELEIGDSVIM